MTVRGRCFLSSDGDRRVLDVVAVTTTGGTSSQPSIARIDRVRVSFDDPGIGGQTGPIGGSRLKPARATARRWMFDEQGAVAHVADLGRRMRSPGASTPRWRIAGNTYVVLERGLIKRSAVLCVSSLVEPSQEQMNHQAQH